MKQNRVTSLLTAHKPILQQRYDVTDLALLGSTARDTATAGSDIDILVAFDGPATSKRYFGVLFYLEEAFSGRLIVFAGNVEAYTCDMTQAEFIADERTYDAILRHLALIGEGARRIPEPIRSQHPDVSWRLIIATRNLLIHAYLGIDHDTVWSIIQDDVPDLIQALNAMLQAR